MAVVISEVAFLVVESVAKVCVVHHHFVVTFRDWRHRLLQLFEDLAELGR